MAVYSLATCEALKVTGVRASGVLREPPRAPPAPAPPATLVPPAPPDTLVDWNNSVNSRFRIRVIVKWTYNGQWGGPLLFCFVFNGR
ncbi:unnamed protein product [Pieris macdunnoughi]|uniref:Uncharacterized protein n=1 Tax=Pieris macdunnoughi TaxID=345717 RepID=A0A821WB47_9NEOP|nr:unnamed protein product [Pieris macdunnoughi]